MLRSKFDIEKNHQATYRDLHTVHTYSQLAVINIDSKKSLKGRKNETAYWIKGRRHWYFGKWIFTSFLHRHSDIIICRPLCAQWHPLRMITFANLERCIFSLWDAEWYESNFNCGVKGTYFNSLEWTFGEFFSFLFVPEYILLTARFCGSSKVMWEGWFNVFIVLKKYEKDDSILL